LTEEEIAIFRHSEIQELIKLYRNEDSDGETSGEGAIGGLKPGNSSESPSTAISERPKQASDIHITKLRGNATPTPKIQKAKGKRVQKRKRETHASSDSTRHDPAEFQATGESRTYRRICREMDMQKTDSVDLDY
jgi:hypothetical protein